MNSLTHGTHRFRRTGWQFLSLLMTLSLAVALLGSTYIPASAGDDALKADPRLLQMAAENPDATFMVIVQKEAQNKDLPDDDPEVAVEKGGGQLKKQLDLIVSFSAEVTGKELRKLARNPKVRWISADALMVSAAAPGMETVQDDFSARSYTGNNGTAVWSTGWMEYGEFTSATAGSIQVVSGSPCSGGSGYCLRLDPNTYPGDAVVRQANLSGMVSVWLSLDRNNLLNLGSGTSEQVQLQVSPDGGFTWTTLQTYSSTSNTGAATDSFDISSYAGASTQIRFVTSQVQIGSRYIYFDNIEIAFAHPSAFLPTLKANLIGLDGSGVTVAVVDSGINMFHPDLSGNAGSRVVAGTQFGSSLNTDDENGHGTHVAGVISGSGAASNGQYRGVAPGADLVNVKVSDMYGMTYESNLLEGLQWIYDNRSAYNIRVVNISINSTVAQSYHTSPLDAAVEILWLNGIVVVVSAGNNGTGTAPSVLYPPANDPFVITVGSTEDKGTSSLGDDSMAIFSAYGTTEDGFAKPDLVAPGRNIVAPLGSLDNAVFQLHPLFRVDDNYFRMSGTSMSAPMVSGTVALLLQDEPYLTPDQVKYRLKSTANGKWMAYNPSKAGSGYLDVYAAVRGFTTRSANTGIPVSQLLMTGSDPAAWGSVGWNSVGWNTVGWNSVGWNTVGWNTVGWNTVGWNTNIWGP
jgi:serine protease AprX